MLHYCRSKAEKVFRPWWDTLEDYLLNSLVLLGEPESLFAINIFSIHIIPMIGSNRPRQWNIFALILQLPRGHCCAHAGHVPLHVSHQWSWSHTHTSPVVTQSRCEGRHGCFQWQTILGTFLAKTTRRGRAERIRNLKCIKGFQPKIDNCTITSTSS